MTSRNQITVENGTALAAAIDEGLTHHRAGRLAEAEAAYRRVLAVQPDHSGALHLLGVIAHQADNNDVAIELIGKAISTNPSSPAYHNNIGEAYRASGRFEEAVAAYRCALELNPDYPEAHNNLGNALEHQGNLEDAVALYHRALALKPDYAEAH